MMTRFPEPLRVEMLNSQTWRLLEPFAYIDADHGQVDVPARFDTDFASVRPLRTIAVGLLALSLVVGWFLPMFGAVIGTAGFGALSLYASVVGYGHAAAVIHDRLYAAGLLSRKAADQVFYNVLRSSGVARWRAWLMWAGVRLGGRFRFGRGKAGER